MTPDTIQSLSSGSNAKSHAVDSGRAGGADDDSPAAIRQFCNERFTWLYLERESWRPHLLDCADFILPRVGRMFITPNTLNRGAKVTRRIVNGEATRAAGTLASGMLTGMTPPSRPWFLLGVQDQALSQTGPVRAWLDVVRDRMAIVLSRSGLYDALHALYGEQGTFGTGVLMSEEDRNRIIRFRHIRVGEYLLAVNAQGEVDTMYRDYIMTVRQLVDRFGYDACSGAAQAAYRNKQFGLELEVIHAIEPNPRAMHVGMGSPPPGWAGGFAGTWPYRSVYFERGGDGDKLLELSGYHECPFAAARWEVYGNDAYGRGPGMMALPEAKSLQVLERRMAEAAAKAAAPPTKAPKRLENAALNLFPDGITFTDQDTDGSLKPIYEMQFEPGVYRPLIEDKVRAIRACFFADLFFMQSEALEGSRQPPTAEEIRVRQEEKLLQLGPVVERNQNELLGPLIDRTFRVMLRARILPPPPAEIRGVLSGERLDVTYISTLAQAQRASSTTAIERMFQFVGNIAAAKPEALAKVDVFEAIDDYADALLVPPKVIVDTETAKAQVAEQRQAMAAQQQGANAMAAVQGAQTLSQTDVGGGQNALAAILGNGPSQQAVPARP